MLYVITRSCDGPWRVHACAFALSHFAPKPSLPFLDPTDTDPADTFEPHLDNAPVDARDWSDAHDSTDTDPADTFVPHRDNAPVGARNWSDAHDSTDADTVDWDDDLQFDAAYYDSEIDLLNEELASYNEDSARSEEDGWFYDDDDGLYSDDE